MGMNPVILGVAGIFIMLSFFALMIGALLFMATGFYLGQLLFGLVCAWIGFYLLGVGSDLDRPK